MFCPHDYLQTYSHHRRSNVSDKSESGQEKLVLSHYLRHNDSWSDCAYSPSPCSIFAGFQADLSLHETAKRRYIAIEHDYAPGEKEHWIVGRQHKAKFRVIDGLLAL